MFRLYLTYMDTGGYGLGLRPGTVVQLLNVHILRPPNLAWKVRLKTTACLCEILVPHTHTHTHTHTHCTQMLGGFYCCPSESHISIVKFSDQLSSVKVHASCTVASSVVL